MTTITTYNCAVSPAIHSLGSRLRLKFPQTSYATHLAHELRRFYAKQTQSASSKVTKNAKKSLIFRCFRDVSTRLAMFAHVSNTVFTPKPRSFYAKQTQFRTHRFGRITVQAFSLPNNYGKTSRCQRRKSTFEHKMPSGQNIPMKDP